MVEIMTRKGEKRMHTFQPMKTNQFECNPFKTFPEEYALISAGDKNKYNTMTVSWGGFGQLWGKDVCFVFIRESRYTKEFIDSGDLFTISFLGGAYKDALELCGKVSGRDGDKFKLAKLTPAFRHGIPYADEANLVFLCEKIAEMEFRPEMFDMPDIEKKWYADGDYHTMYIAEVVEVVAR